MRQTSFLCDIGVESLLSAGVEQTFSPIGTGRRRYRAASDFALARQVGASTYPTLLFVDGPKVQSLPATGAALEVLNERLDALLA